MESEKTYKGEHSYLPITMLLGEAKVGSQASLLGNTSH